MDKQRMKRDAEQYVNGSSFMTQTQFAGWLGVGRTTAREILLDVQPAYEKHYFIPEILDALERRKDKGERYGR